MFITYYVYIKNSTEGGVRMDNFDDKEKELEKARAEEQERLRAQQSEENRRHQPSPEERPKKKSGKGGVFLSGLIGVIVGALLVWLILPSISDTMPSSTSTNKVKTEQVSTEVTTDVTGAVEKAKEAVVGITNIQKQQSVEDIFGLNENGSSSKNGESSSEGNSVESGSGSGVVYKTEGNKAYIVTNNHVVDGADELEVMLASGKKVKAELVGTDPLTDLAVITMDKKNATTVTTFGDSDKLKQGETVIAIGNPLGLDLYGSVTTGVISGTERTVPSDINGDGIPDWNAEVLQTDAAINPGNSGGALINLAGQTIGINSMKIAESSVEGLGFSIPINTAIPIIEELEAKGEVERPSIGVSLIDLSNIPAFYQEQALSLPEDITEGVIVGEVESGSAADKAGLEQYDVIVEMGGKKVADAVELRKVLYSNKVGDKVKVKVYRSGELEEFEIKLTSTLTK